MAEVPVDSHRELKTATVSEAREILHKLRRAVKASTQSRFAKRVMVDNKEACDGRQQGGVHYDHGATAPD
jgi:hypothetical protein